MKLINNVRTVLSSVILWTFITSIVSITFLGFITYEATKASVKVTSDEGTEVVRTHAGTFGELLNELGISPQSYDEMSHELEDPLQFGMDVAYIESQALNVTIGDNTKRFYTTANTVGEFFEDHDLQVKEQDKVSHKSSETIHSNMDINIQKAVQITVDDGGDVQDVWTTASTVGDFLNEENITLDEMDKLNLGKEQGLKQGEQISITRLEKATEEVEENLGYSVITEKDPSLPEGEEKVVSTGTEGKVVKEYEIIIENGEEIKRELVHEDVIKESKDRIIAIGSKQKPSEKSSRSVADSKKKDSKSEPKAVASASSKTKTTSKGSQEKKNGKTLKMKATAYTADCTGCSGKTATGINLKADPNKKVIAVDPSIIPLGSEVWVEGYGNAIAGDTGGAIQGKKIDVHVPSKSEAYSFGNKTVEVKVLD
ncbi:G5 and 3D domain-containing protein [Halobacillus campisalis]|uniref:Ubiquitin-like domain-containing protein n=1 Tax=Halobacillus campisalis TaxID=435909 RepID=A0ABW2K857_9BACI|nr:G5 and 3D domain-containing protein [Halobacillus campisalis]